jgi:hypothetical protein
LIRNNHQKETFGMHGINVWAVLLASVMSFLLGGVWYSHRVFGGFWNREAGRGREAHQPHPARVFGTSFIFCLISAAAFAVWLGPTPSLESAVLNGLAAGVCLIAASMGMTYQFANLSLPLWLIDGGYHAARFVLFGLIFGLWH